MKHARVRDRSAPGRAHQRIVGILGAVLGGWVFAQMGWATPFSGLIGVICVAFIGAVLLLFVLGLLRRGRGRRP